MRVARTIYTIGHGRREAGELVTCFARRTWRTLVGARVLGVALAPHNLATVS
jgi:hypothetical protein